MPPFAATALSPPPAIVNALPETVTDWIVALRPLTAGLLLSLLVMYLRGLLLPIWSHVFQGIRETRERGHLCILWGVLGAANLEALTLTETGFRANDGNFEWGSLTLCPTVFAVAITLLWRLLGRTDWKKRPELLRAVVGIILLLGHLAVGAYCLYRPGHAGYDWFYFSKKDIYRTKAVLQIAFGCDKLILPHFDNKRKRGYTNDKSSGQGSVRKYLHCGRETAKGRGLRNC